MPEAPAIGPGFQGSETSGVEVRVYTKPGTDRVLDQARGVITFEGRRGADDDGSLVQVTTNKSIGSPSGTWSFVVKPSRSGTYPDLRELIADDDWVDIVFKRHGKPWHVMRGMVDEVRRIRNVSGNGATTTEYLVTGRDFGKVWESTPVWFNRFTAENVGGAISIRIFSGVNFTGSVPNTVFGILRGFIAELGNLGRALWEPPPGVPNVIEGSFVNSVVFNKEKFRDDPVRFAVSPQLMDPQGQGCWELGKEWSDPTFCELWCDLLDGEVATGDQFYGPSDVPVDRTVMGVVLRDLPYVNATEGRQSPWFDLPITVVPKQAIVSHDIGRSGLERYNAFFVGPQVNQDFGVAQRLDITAPLWDTEDIKLHGIRRFDVDTHYAATQSEILTLTFAQREKVRDWYCMNPYLYNGTIALARSFPEIRIGTRLLIPGDNGETDQETYYVENVSHTWSFGPGGRTTLGVTRGWIGSDDDYLRKLDNVIARYEQEVPVSQPGDFTEAIDTGELIA